MTKEAELLTDVEVSAQEYRRASIAEADARVNFVAAVRRAEEGGVKISDIVDVSKLSRQTIWNVRR